ncbi:hypothetical protein LTR17_021029 [Elasticomyces elasticus]|nr:hypothetical protein LTR17_021029 [Elasticomyces elasticus]
MAVPHLTPDTAHELVYEPQQLSKLRLNYGGYLDQSSVGWLKRTSAYTSLDEMRMRFEADGYLFIKGLVPRGDILGVRERYFEHLRSTGILKPGTSPREGIFDATQDPLVHNGVGGRDLPEDVERQKLLESAHTLRAYPAFLEHSDLRDFIPCSWDGIKTSSSSEPSSAYSLSNDLRSHNVPNGLPTGCHYDRIFLRAGEDFLTAWVPIGDCTADGGGLMYLEGSTDVGKAMEADFMERAEHLTPEERIDGFNQNMARDGQLSHNVVELDADINAKYSSSKRRRWLGANYEAGDVVFHNPYMIHGAGKNEDPLERTRLRYHAIHAAMLEYHVPSAQRKGLHRRRRRCPLSAIQHALLRTVITTSGKKVPMNAMRDGVAGLVDFSYSHRGEVACCCHGRVLVPEYQHHYGTLLVIRSK